MTKGNKKMSTRRGNVVTVDDLLATGLGMAFIAELKTTDEDTQRHLYKTIGRIVGRIIDSIEKGERTVIYNLDEDWD